MTQQATERPAGADWVRGALHVEPSRLGAKVADLLGAVFGGIYNAPIEETKIDWTDAHCIEIRTHSDFATYDLARLTTLVLGAHALGVRVEISARSHTYLTLMFHLRDGSAPSNGKQQPTIDEAVAQFRQYSGWLEELR